MRPKIIFDEQTTQIHIGSTIATIRTGESQGARNHKAALAAQSPRDAARLNRGLEAVAERCSQGGAFEPHIPQLEEVGGGLWLMFGLVITGQGRWLTTATFYFVLVVEDEIDHFITHLFKFERALKV